LQAVHNPCPCSVPSILKTISIKNSCADLTKDK
jgi:hypothetical protein